jgi:cyclopropane-fatty-acyl-phospholipid synthase
MNTITKNLIKNSSVTSYWGKLFINVISKISKGDLTIITPNGKQLNFSGDKKGEDVTIKINNWKMAESLFLKGDIGLGESYITNYWESDNINGLIRLGVDNYKEFGKVIKGAILRIAYYRFKHIILNRNTKNGSKKNIHAHYDLGNDFYNLWLDNTMTYSSALFCKQELTLQEAQENKYQKIIDQLNLSKGDHILEVGCGWGGFMEYAATKGIKVTGVTISKEQYDFAVQRLDKYKDLCNVKLQDYREISGKYDHIVSIEMFEALGQSYWKTYFNIISSVLNDNGKIVIQSITINDKDFKSYSKSTDFIQQYIFPGGMLPSPNEVVKQSKLCGLYMENEIKFGPDYGKTLDIWEKQFTDKLSKVKEQGFDEGFIRTWRFYLKYCQGGFEAGKIGVSQFCFTRTKV